MKKYLLLLLLTAVTFTVYSQNHVNEAISLKPKKTDSSNPNVVFLDASKTFDLPADGAFLYSSLKGETGIVSSGYSNNEDYIITIQNKYNRRIFLRSSYFLCEGNKDVLKIYDGKSTEDPLIKELSGISDQNFLILSSGDYLTLHFKSDNSGTSKGFRFRLDNGPGIQNKPSLPLPTPMSCASSPAADECVNAPLICDLNGYCGNTSGAYTAGNTSGLGNFCGSIENNSWLSFVASSTSASLIFTSAGCQDNSSGIQAVIYASTNCSSFTEVSNCESQGNGSGTFTITTNVNLVPGQTYYVMVDGFAGNICSYTVTASTGVALGQQITGPNQLCPGYNGTLSSSSAASSYTWTSNPAGVYPNTQSINITPTVTTTYSLTLGASACAPGGTTVVKTVTVTNTLNPANITAPSPICMTNSVTLTSLTAGGTYSWSGPGGFSANTQNATVNNWAASNNGTYTLVIDYGGGCSTLPATVNLTGSAIPVINISAAPSLTICNGQNVVLTSSGGTGTNGYIWDWNIFQSGLTVTTQVCINIPFVGLQCNNSPFSFPGMSAGPSATVSTTSNAQICVSSENAAGCIGKKCVSIIVLPAAGNLTVSPTATICPGQSTTLSVSGGSSYTWTPASSLSSANGSTVAASPTVTTTYTVSAPACGGSTTTQTVQVIVNGTPPNIGVINGLTNVCSNQTGVTYSVNNVASTNYTWSVPPGASITSAPTNSNSITVDFGSSAGTISVSAASTCGTATASLTVNLNPGLTLTVTPDNSTICNGSSATLTATGATNYTWSPSADLSSSTGSVVTANPVSTTVYTIQGATGSCTGVTTATVNLASSLSLTVTPSNPVVCPAGQANLVASGATTYTWANGATLNTISGASVTSSPIVTTVYTVTGSAGTCTGVATATVTVDNTNCNTGTCNVTQIRAALTAAGNIELLGMNDPCSLYFINPQYMTGPDAQAYAQTFGANLISVQSAAENTNLVTALANQGYSSEVIWIGFSDAISEGNFVWYDGAPVNYTNWNVGEPNNAGGNENCTQIYPNGTWNDLNCSGYNSLSVIEVNLCPQVSIANVPVHCANTVVNLNANTMLGSPNYTYTWTQSGTETFTNTSAPGNTNQISVTSVGPNTFTATSIDRYSCQQFTTINLNVSPSPTITANSSSICTGQQTATLTANGATSYTWSPSTGLSTTNGSVVTANPTVSTTYSIQGTLGSCTDTKTVSVTVNFAPNVYIIQKNSFCDTTVLNWLNITSVTPTLAQGSLPSGLTVNATHSNGGMSTTPSMFSGGTFPATYSVPISSTTIRNDLGGTFNFCFNQPVINPQIAFASIGNGSTPITINTSVPYQIIWAGVNMTYPNPTQLIGQEGFTIIRFPGVHTCVSLDYIGNESYCNLAFGVMDADCQGRPVCPGDPVELIANGATSYTWNNGATTSTITPTPFVTTTYSLSASNANGCTNTASTTVVVNPTPTITANSATICLGQQTATLTANGADTYTWSPSTSLSASTGSVVSATPGSSQSYTVIGTDLNGCISGTITNVAVNPLPSISANTATICLGQQTASLTANGALNYTWSPSATLNSANGTSVTGTPISTTDYTITGEDLNGCVNTGTTTITVVNIPTITVSSNATICPASNTVLIAGGATNYTWAPSTSLNNTNTATVTANPSSSITYTVGGMDNNGCVNINTVQITVAPIPTITASNNATICPAGSIDITASGGISYTWTPSASLNSANGSLVTSTPNSTTIYTVSGESADGCVATNTVEVFVANNPTVTVSSDATVCPLASTTLTASGATSYSWTPNLFLNNDNTSSVVSTPSTTTSYTVTGTLGTCTNTNVVNVIVSNTVVVVASTNNATICPNASATLSASGATSYTWSPAIGLSSTSGTNVTATPLSDQTYTVIGSTSTCTNIAQVVITVTTNPIVTVNSSIICSGNSANLSASGASTYSWNPALFLSSNIGSNVIATPPNTKTYTVIGTSPLGCRGSASTTVEVIPMPNLLVSANPISICPGENASLTASGASSFTWSPAASLTNSVGPTTSASPTMTTTYLLIGANGTAPNLCTSTKTVEINVKPTTTVTVGTPDPICFGSYTKLDAHGGTIYNWQPSAGISHPNDSVVDVGPSVSTIYTVTVNNPGYCANTATVEVIVNSLPYVYAGADTTINIDETVTLYGMGDTQVGFLSPETYPLNCNLCPIVTVQLSESTCFILKGTSAAGCTNFDTVCVNITKDWNVYIPNAFTPNGDGINDLFIPAGYAIEKINMTIFDRWGAVIFQTDPDHQGWDGKYKGVICEQGVYVYQIEVISMGGASMKKVGHVTLLPLKK